MFPRITSNVGETNLDDTNQCIVGKPTGVEQRRFRRPLHSRHHCLSPKGVGEGHKYKRAIKRARWSIKAKIDRPSTDFSRSNERRFGVWIKQTLERLWVPTLIHVLSSFSPAVFSVREDDYGGGLCCGTCSYCGSSSHD